MSTVTLSPDLGPRHPAGAGAARPDGGGEAFLGVMKATEPARFGAPAKAKSQKKDKALPDQIFVSSPQIPPKQEADRVADDQATSSTKGARQAPHEEATSPASPGQALLRIDGEKVAASLPQAEGQQGATAQTGAIGAAQDGADSEVQTPTVSPSGERQDAALRHAMTTGKPASLREDRPSSAAPAKTFDPTNGAVAQRGAERGPSTIPKPMLQGARITFHPSLPPASGPSATAQAAAAALHPPDVPGIRGPGVARGSLRNSAGRPHKTTRPGDQGSAPRGITAAKTATMLPPSVEKRIAPVPTATDLSDRWEQEAPQGLVPGPVPGPPDPATVAQAAPQTTQPPHPAAQAARQLAQAAQAAPPPGTTELLLKPEELGKVRMRFRHHDGVVMVTISAERPDTLQMLRSHAHVLTQEFASAGLTGSHFTFDDHPQTDRQGEDEGSGPPTAPITPSPPLPVSVERRPLTAGATLDLRL